VLVVIDTRHSDAGVYTCDVSNAVGSQRAQYSLQVIYRDIISASLHRAKRYWYGTFVPPICRSSHVSSGNTGDWIGMPFGVVSGVRLGMGILDFDGDRRRERGSFGVNTMQKWHIDRLSTCV